MIDARGRIVMPGFIDTHHHLFETALRSFLADGLLFDGLDPDTTQNYFQKILLTFAPVYRPQDVYINTLFGSLSQLDAGVTTVHDISQIHHSPAHTDATIKALRDSGGAPCSATSRAPAAWPATSTRADARRIKQQHFSSNDQLVTMTMGGEIYLPGYEAAWTIGRELALPVACAHRRHLRHAADLRRARRRRRVRRRQPVHPHDRHVRLRVAEGARRRRGVSLAVPIEMNMRHGTPPIHQGACDLGFKPSLSTDVECTLTADMFTQMRSAMALQRMFVNASALGENGPAEHQPAGRC